LNTFDSVKTILPLTLRRRLRSMHRLHTLRNAVAECRERLATKQSLPDELLDRMIYGWSNEGWSAKIELLRALLDQSYDAGTIALECGTGLSTVLFALISEHSGATIVSLEHDATWHQLIISRLTDLGLPSSGIRLAPLRDYGEYDWYDRSLLAESDSGFTLALCDGPPGSTRGGRFGLLPTLLGKFQGGARIIVDDTVRADEQCMIKRWSENFPGRVEVCKMGTSYALLKVL
jgi:hypothetical protein